MLARREVLKAALTNVGEATSPLGALALAGSNILDMITVDEGTGSFYMDLRSRDLAHSLCAPRLV